MTARARRDARALLALTLSAFAVTALVAAPADGWRRPTDFPVYSSPSGGEYRVCRDGILFQAGTGRVDDPTSPPAEPTSPVGFTVFSASAQSIPSPARSTATRERSSPRERLTFPSRRRPS